MALTKDLRQFFIDLSRNNHKEWFDENRKRYENHVKKPLYQLVGDVIELVKKIDPNVTMQPKDAVFRINRDIRFSKDKSPYKLHVAAHISPSVKKDTQTPGIYFQVSAESLWIGSGIYEPDKQTLEDIRYHIAGHQEQFSQLISNKTFLRYFKSGIAGEKNKVIPKELKEAAERQPLIYNKQFYYFAEYEDDSIIFGDTLAAFIVEHFKAAQPLNTFFREAIK